jgi:hypothetical protein
LFKNKEKAQVWEYKVLKRMKVLENQNVWLNRTDNHAIVYEMTQELIDRRTAT